MISNDFVRFRRISEHFLGVRMSSYDFIGFRRISEDFIDIQRISEPWTRPESLHACNALKSNRGASLIIRTATFIGTLPNVPIRFRYSGEKSEA